MLALLPIVGSPFQARFTGPHTVLRQTLAENYFVSTPERRKKSQLCHINLLKPYYSHVVKPGVTNVCSLESVKPVANTVVDSSSQSLVDENADFHIFDGVRCGHLKNMETLKNLG